MGWSACCYHDPPLRVTPPTHHLFRKSYSCPRCVLLSAGIYSRLHPYPPLQVSPTYSLPLHKLLFLYQTSPTGSPLYKTASARSDIGSSRISWIPRLVASAFRFSAPAHLIHGSLLLTVWTLLPLRTFWSPYSIPYLYGPPLHGRPRVTLPRPCK